jgi:PAS domain S-box-containing protein
VPVVVLTGLDDESLGIEALRRGAQDYLVKKQVLGKGGILRRVLNYAMERKRAEEALARQAEERHILLDNIQIQVWYLTDDHTYGAVNRAHAEFTGVKVEDLAFKDMYDIFPKDVVEVCRQGNIEVFSTGKPGCTEEWMPHVSGERRLLSITKSPKMDAGGKVEYVVCSAEDITERKRAEEALRQAEENFRRSQDDSPLGVCIVTADGDTLYANRAILEMYDFDTLEELRNTAVKKRYAQESFVEFQKRMEIRQSGDSGPSEYEISIVRKNGEVRHLHVFRKEILWNGEKQFQTLYRDITEDKKREEILRQFEATIQGQKLLLDQQSSSVEKLIGRLTRSRVELAASYEALKANKDDLVHSEKLAFAGRMASSISHEIRNPLTNIILSIRQLKKDDKIKPEILNYAEIVERNTNRIEFLVTELLNCARPIKLNLQPWDVHLVIKDILNVHKVRLKMQGIKVIKNLTSHPSLLLFDKEYLGRVFMNLIANAIEAMPPGGNLSITTKKEKGYFVTEIQDNGRGIPEKNLIEIFDPFFSTKKQGAGLGLTTCQNIVTSHGGMIEVESAWRKGTTFSVSLPFGPKPSGSGGNIKGKS